VGAGRSFRTGRVQGGDRLNPVTMRILAHAVLMLSAAVTLAIPLRGVRAQTALDELHHETIAVGREPAKAVEYFWEAPRGKGPWPAIVFIHGYQAGSETPGGKAFVDYGVMDSAASRGYVGIAISQPGFGHSDGPPDFMGPATVTAAEAVIRHVRAEPYLRGDRIGLEGVSRGAVVASLVAARDSTIRAMVLISGAYDFTTTPDSSTAAGRLNVARRDQVRTDIATETDGTAAALQARSPLSVVSRIRTPALILNGAQDDRTDPEQARKLAEGIRRNGVFARAVIYPEFGHAIPYATREREVEPFFRAWLK
jgi:dipeptidyl aminopeptidase/acylaminoacyl peptidase